MSGNGRGFFYRNGLSLAFLFLFLLSILGQSYTGWVQHNEFLVEQGTTGLSLAAYLKSGHFMQATFENWESEFLQMALFIILTIFLRQEGSSESKKCDEPLFDDAELEVKKDSPGPVKKGGWQLKLYKNSLSIVMMLLFVISFLVHAYGSWKDHKLEQLLNHMPPEDLVDYLGSSKLWFESFQNWQSEFLSVFMIVFLSIYLRQEGSPQSKPVNASHRHTGSD